MNAPLAVELTLASHKPHSRAEPVLNARIVRWGKTGARVNPFVAEPEDDTSANTGIGLLEAGQAALDGINNGERRRRQHPQCAHTVQGRATRPACGGGAALPWMGRTWEYQPGSVTPIAQLDQDEVDRRFYAIVADVVGSPTELVDARGQVGWRRTSTLWGRTLSQTGGAACPLRFPGQYHDPETGWHYNHFRYYDPETGRYASPDPLGLVPSVNPGAYVPNPTRQIDPLGLQGCDVSGDEAKQQALADAGVPPGSEPLDSRMVPSTTPSGRQILDENYQPVYFPEEIYLNNRDELIAFQDHYTGHQFGEGGVGDQPPHVHVRPYENTRNGQVPGAQEHYYYNPSLGRPTPAR